mmetsp:Transcript_44369/g.105746  ORF Transcript_44369/g.105746 Transcript_44369/m.105746 type:complete len:217 (-) Transcript_44369:149-799(-)
MLRGNSSRSLSGRSVDAMSTSHGCSPDKQSRTHPPTSHTVPLPSPSIVEIMSSKSSGSLSTNSAKNSGNGTPPSRPSSACCHVIISRTAVALIPPSPALTQSGAGPRSPSAPSGCPSGGASATFLRWCIGETAVALVREPEASSLNWNAGGKVEARKAAGRSRRSSGDGDDSSRSSHPHRTHDVRTEAVKIASRGKGTAPMRGEGDSRRIAPFQGK